jgi:hypothetical protein
MAAVSKGLESAGSFWLCCSLSACQDALSPSGPELGRARPPHALNSVGGQAMHWRFSSGLPFTNTEVFQALELVHPADLVEAFRRDHEGLPDEATNMAVTDDVLLLLAAVSADYAKRVVEFRPDLRTQVDGVRAHPQQFIETERKRHFENYQRERAEGS